MWLLILIIWDHVSYILIWCFICYIIIKIFYFGYMNFFFRKKQIAFFILPKMNVLFRLNMF